MAGCGIQRAASGVSGTNNAADGRTLVSARCCAWARDAAHTHTLRLPPPQVVVAVDDSRSMAETGCGTFALEALTLICRAMARLEVNPGTGKQWSIAMPSACINTCLRGRPPPRPAAGHVHCLATHFLATHPYGRHAGRPGHCCEGKTSSRCCSH